MNSHTRRRRATLAGALLVTSFVATVTAGGAQAVSFDHPDLYVTSRGTPCEAVIGVHSFFTAVPNVHLHAPGGIDRDQGTIEAGQSIAVAVPGCTAAGSSSFQLVWVTGDGDDANPFNNAALV